MIDPFGKIFIIISAIFLAPGLFFTLLQKNSLFKKTAGRYFDGEKEFYFTFLRRNCCAFEYLSVLDFIFSKQKIVA